MRKLIVYFITGVVLLGKLTTGDAAIPVSMTFAGGTTSFDTTSSGSANYIVSMNRAMPFPLTLQFISGGSNNETLLVTQKTSGSSNCSTVNGVNPTTVCQNPFQLSPGQSCCLELTLSNSSSGARTYSILPIVTTTIIPTYQYSPASAQTVTATETETPGATTTTLSASVSTLVLSVKDTAVNSNLTGHARVITITNTGTNTATNLSVSASGLPNGTDITTVPTTCTGTLAPNATCTVTVTPGANATSSCNTGIAPTAGTVTVSASNVATSATTNVVVLMYACIYQGGYVYSIDDTRATSGSIGGIVLQQTDNTGALDGIVWDSSTDCTNPLVNNCYTTNADSGINGTKVAPTGNTYLIYQTLTTMHGELATSYAAGLCTGVIGSYSNWYLPAICEMGYGPNFGGIDCGTQLLPIVSQNIQATLIDVTTTDIAGLTKGNTGGDYWSSTEEVLTPTQVAWHQLFAVAGGVQLNAVKGLNPLGVRCSRAF